MALEPVKGISFGYASDADDLREHIDNLETLRQFSLSKVAGEFAVAVNSADTINVTVPLDAGELLTRLANSQV